MVRTLELNCSSYRNPVAWYLKKLPRVLKITTITQLVTDLRSLTNAKNKISQTPPSGSQINQPCPTTLRSKNFTTIAIGCINIEIERMKTSRTEKRTLHLHQCKTVQDEVKLNQDKTRLLSLEGKITTACCLISIHKLGLAQRRLLSETLADRESFREQKSEWI